MTTEPILFLRMTGRCANGAERDGGRVVHAVPGGGWAAALCGATPGYKGNGWSEWKQPAVTCPRCLKRMAWRPPTPSEAQAAVDLDDAIYGRHG